MTLPEPPVKQDPVTDSRPAAPPLRVVAADDSYLIREAIQAVLATSDRIDLVALSEDGDQLWQAVVDEAPDVVIVDIRMPPSGDFEGINIARRMRDEFPDIGLIALSQWAEPSLAVSLLRPSAQGRGYLLKDRLYDRSELLQAIEVIAHGGSVIDPVVVEHLIQGARRPSRSPIDELTPREQEVLALMARGKSNAAIAADLTLTKRAVEKHVGSIFMKLMLEDESVVSRRVAAVLMYLADFQPRGELA
ncbi:MAG TPA: response regulator transcription factor [Candidatus Limnocylindrales bacterium]|nr:response regulator transcription factor [Candidatus Limnocylindrales bacterium]